MITLKDSIVIKRPPEAIFEWFDHFMENYKKWHPKDHVSAKWIKGKNFEEGSVLYVEEYLGEKLEKLKFKGTKKIKNKLIEYKLLFPHSLICSGGSFVVKPHKTGSVFTATLSFPFGSILSKLMPARVKALKKHMKEEGENLKKLLEQRR